MTLRLAREAPPLLWRDVVGRHRAGAIPGRRRHAEQMLHEEVEPLAVAVRRSRIVAAARRMVRAGDDEQVEIPFGQQLLKDDPKKLIDPEARKDLQRFRSRFNHDFHPQIVATPDGGRIGS